MCEQVDKEKVYLRLAEQATQVFKMICSAKETKVRCQGTQPSRPDGREHNGCGKYVRIDRAYKCLYCGFYFCANCAEVHFGKTRGEHIKELKATGEYHGVL